MISVILLFLRANRGAAECVALFLLCGLVVGAYGWHERAAGAEKCVQADQTAKVDRLELNAQLDASQTREIAREIQTESDALAAPVSVPIVRLCRYPGAGAVSPADRPAGGGDAATGGGKGDSEGARAATDGDAGEALAAAGRRADAQLAMLQDYVKNVCLEPR